MPPVWEVYGQGGVWDHLFPQIACHLDPLTTFYLSQIIPVYTHGYGLLIEQLCAHQVAQLAIDIQAFRYQVVSNLPSRTNNRGAGDRVSRDLAVLHTLKMRNLNYTRAIQTIIAHQPDPPARLKQFWYRLLSGVGRKASGENGQHYGQLYIMLDIHTQNLRFNWEEYPLWKLAVKSRGIVCDRHTQFYQPYVKEASPFGLVYRWPQLRYFTDTINTGIPTGGYQYEDFFTHYLKFLRYKHTSCSIPKRTSTYVAHTRIEPLFDALPPLEMKRHLLDTWRKAWHRQIQHAQAAPDCTVKHVMRRQLKAPLHYHLKLIERYTGVGLQHLTGRHNAPPIPLLEIEEQRKTYIKPLVVSPYSCSATLRNATLFNTPEPTSLWLRDREEPSCLWGHEHSQEAAMTMTERSSWFKTLMTHVPVRPANTYALCFHRVPHTCAKCCEQAPHQELFFAYTPDTPASDLSYMKAYNVFWRLDGGRRQCPGCYDCYLLSRTKMMRKICHCVCWYPHPAASLDVD